MYNHTVITAAVFAILTVNLCIASNGSLRNATFVDQNVDGKVYDVLYGMSENLSAILLNPMGRQTINVVRENLEDVAINPLTHNAIIDLLDLVTTLLTNPNASRSILNLLAAVQTFVTDPEIHKVVAVGGRGIVDIMSMKNIGAVAEVLLAHMESMLSTSNFDKNFPMLMQSMAGMFNTRKNHGYTGHATAMAHGITGRAAAVAQGISGSFKRMASFGRSG